MKLTLIEALILLAIGLIVVMILLSRAHEAGYWGINGLTEVRCIGGFKHTVGDGGQARQMLDENGHGIRCN